MKNLLFYIILLLTSLASITAQVYYEDTLNGMGFSPDQDDQVLNLIYSIHTYDEHEGDTSAYYDPIPEISFDRVVYAPDSAFRVYRWEWEECGAYCNTNDRFVMAYEEPVNHKLAFYDFKKTIRGTVDSIKMIEPGLYLMFQSYGSRARSIESQTCLSARLISLHDPVKTIWYFSFCTSNLATYDEEILQMNYKAESSTISYRYQYYIWDDPKRVYIKSGTWQYVDGNYNVQEEKTVFSVDGVPK